MTEDVSAGRLYTEVVGDTSGFGRDLQRKINAEVKNIRAKIQAEINSRGLITQAREAAKEASKAATVKFKVELDTRGLITQARAAAAAAGQAATVKLRAELDTSQVVTKAREAAAEASKSGIDLNVGADTAKADADVEKFRQTNKRRPVDIPIRVDSKGLGQAGTALMALSKAPAIAGGVFLLGTAVVQLGGGLLAMASYASQAIGVLGAIPNLVGVAAQGVGSLVIGFSGVGDALKAMGQAEQASTAATATGAAQARATAKAVESASRARARAARSVEDAQRSLADAQRNADDVAVSGARAVADARRALADAQERAVESERSSIERVSDAEWSLARAQESATDAQEALTQARVDARERIDDLNRALKGSALDEEAAMLAVEQARKNLEDANWNPMSSDLQKKQADLAYRQAIQNLDDVKDRSDDLRKETEKANKQGVDGADEVQQAQDQVRDTMHAEQEAAEQLADAQRAAAKDQRDSARAIADAQQALADTFKSNARASEDAARQIEQAQRGIADAQQNLADAEDNLAEAQKTAAAGGTAAANAAKKAEDALARLSPAGQKFAKFLFGLKPRWIELRNAIQEALLPPLQRGIQSALPLLDTLQTGLVGSAKVVGGLAEDLGKLFGEKTFRSDVGTIMASNNRALALFGQTGLNVIQILQNLGVAAGPLVERFAAWTTKITGAWLETIKLKRSTGELSEFFQKSGDVAAQLGRILGNIGTALFNIGKSAAPTGQELFDAIDRVTQRWADWTGSDDGQQRMQRFFEATKPATEELGKLVSNLVEFITKTGEAGGGSLNGFLGTLNAIFSALNSIMSVPGVGPAVGGLLTLAGSAGALGLVAGAILKVGKNVAKIGKVTGITRLIQGFRGAKDAIDDELPADKKKKDALDGVEGAAGKAGGTLKSKFIGAVKASTTAVAGAAKALGGWVASIGRAAAGMLTLTARVVANRAATVASTVAQNIAKVATAVWTAVTYGLGVAMKFALGPVGLVITIIGLLVGAIVYAYKNHEGFRDLVQKVWSAIQTAASYAWNSILKPVFGAIVTALQETGKFFGWLWDKAIKPALGLIQQGFSLWWNNYAKPILGAFVWSIQQSGKIMAWLWEKAVKPALGAIGNFFKSTWEKVIKPAWDALTTGLAWGWDHVVKPAFDALGSVVGGLGKAFDAAREAVKTAWDKVKQVVKDPIRGVLELVNNWVIDKFNWVSGKLGGPQIDKIDLSKFRDGGDIPGPRRGATADNVIIRATPDEFMVRRWAADKLRRFAPGALEYINKFGTLPGMPGYASGGFVRPVNAPWAGTWGHYASGGNHPALDFPVPVGTPVSAVMDGVVNAVRSLTGSYGKHIRISHENGIESIYAHLSKQIVQVGQKVQAGQLIGASGNTGNSTGPHLHLELRRGGTPFDFTDMLTSGKAPGTKDKNKLQELFGSVVGKVKGAIGEPLQWFKEQISKPIQALKDKFGNSSMVQMVTGMPQKIVEAAAAKVKGLLGLASEQSSDTGVGTSNQGNRDIVRAAAAGRGWTGIQWQALEWLVEHESSFNNLAQNPTSTAFGLFQFLDSTWGSVGGYKTSDASLQTQFGLKYIAQRYGNPVNAKAFWQAHNWYDSGGWMMPGTGLHTNATGQPEAVLTNSQWSTVDSILSRLAAVSSGVHSTAPGSAKGAALVENLTVSVGEKRDLPDALDEVEHHLRVINRGGVYASES